MRITLGIIFSGRATWSCELTKDVLDNFFSCFWNTVVLINFCIFFAKKNLFSHAERSIDRDELMRIMMVDDDDEELKNKEKYSFRVNYLKFES